MIIAGMHFKKEIPFKDVYFTSTVRDMQGRKMSKSLGNSPDPLDLIVQYGADSLRFTMNYIAPLGQDVMFQDSMCEIGRNFSNKIWNAARFLLMNAQNIKLDKSLADKHLDFADRWIISRFQSTVKEFSAALDKFEINNTTKIIYSFVWNDFCDWYIELSKTRLYKGEENEKSAVLTRALGLFEEMLKVVHPFMPYITEEIWHLLEERKEGESISMQKFPQYNLDLIDEDAEKQAELLQSVITALRNIRGEMNLPPSKTISAILKTDKLKEVTFGYIKALAKVDNLVVGSDVEKPKASASAVVKDCDIYVPLEGLIDLDIERSRIEKEIVRIEGSLQGVTKKLSNESFVGRAPADVVEKEKAKKEDWEKTLEKLKVILHDLK